MAAKKSGPAPAVMAMIEQHDQKEEQAMETKAADVANAFPALVAAANEMIDVSDRLDGLESQVKDLKQRKEHLRKSIIPDLMRKAGIVDSKNKGSFTVPGRKIYLETRLNASVTQENLPKFFAWLRSNKLGEIIKETVHNQTLTSFIKNRRAEGLEVPPTVSVYEETVAKTMKA